MTETLTADVVLAMPAGPELDALVVERVMGWRKVPGPDADPSGWRWLTPEGNLRPPDAGCWYSVDINAAWEVVESQKMCAVGVSPDPGVRPFYAKHRIWSETVFAETGPLAICRAALLAVCDVRASDD